MDRFFQILAVILAGVAAYFLWQKNADSAFVSAALGAVSFFLSMRFQIKGRLKQRAAEEEETSRRRDEENIEPNLLSDEFDLPDRIDNGQPATDNKQRANL